MSNDSQRHTIRQTGMEVVMVAGFPGRQQLKEWLAEEHLTVFCLFPAAFRADQVQVELRQRLSEELRALGEGTDLTKALGRCTALVVAESALGDTLEQFDFDEACKRALNQLTPAQPKTVSAVTIPTFGD